MAPFAKAVKSVRCVGSQRTAINRQRLIDKAPDHSSGTCRRDPTLGDQIAYPPSTRMGDPVTKED